MLRNYRINSKWKEKLNSIIHVDGSCRLQILNNKSEPLYRIIEYFNMLTGIPAVLNTSFNDNGKPIPNYKEFIFQTYKNLDNIDYLIYNNNIYTKDKDNNIIKKEL